MERMNWPLMTLPFQSGWYIRHLIPFQSGWYISFMQIFAASFISMCRKERWNFSTIQFFFFGLPLLWFFLFQWSNSLLVLWGKHPIQEVYEKLVYRQENVIFSYTNSNLMGAPKVNQKQKACLICTKPYSALPKALVYCVVIYQ